MQFDIVVHKTRIACSAKICDGRGSVHNGRACNSPIATAAVSPLISQIWLYATFNKVLDACAGLLPTLPYAHPYASAKPLIHLLEVFLGIRKFEVVHPSADGLVQYLFPAFITHPVTPARDEFEFRSHLLQALGVDA